jgi:hypothetical protein
LGDEFDSHYDFPKVAGIKETAKFALELMWGAYGPSTCLVGNHLLAYMESWYANSRYSNKHQLYNCCSGFSNSKSIEINKIFKWEDYQKYQLFAEFGGFLFSHAGFHPTLWNFYKSKDENLKQFWDESKDAIHSISVKPHTLFGCGYSRGGRNPVGGPVWLDFWEEFIDNDEMPPQIVGHTQSHNAVKQTGRSYCIDGAQNTYIIIKQDGEFLVKTTAPSGKWTLVNTKYPPFTTSL